MICKLGTFVEFSVMREPVTTDWTIIGDTKELNIHGAHWSPHCYPIAIRRLEQGLLPMDQIVTHQLPLEDCSQGDGPRRRRNAVRKGDIETVMEKNMSEIYSNGFISIGWKGRLDHWGIQGIGCIDGDGLGAGRCKNRNMFEDAGRL